MGKMYKVTVGDKVKEYPSGTVFEQVARDNQGDYKAHIVLARVGGKLKELNKKVNSDCEVDFKTVSDRSGYKTYRRTATFIMIKAIRDVAGIETLEKIKEEYPDFNKLHVFKVRSVDSVCNEIEEKLDVRDYGKINTIIDSLQPEMAGNPRIKYLKALALYKQEKYSLALEVLDDEVFSELGEVGARELMIMLEKIIGGKNG